METQWNVIDIVIVNNNNLKIVDICIYCFLLINNITSSTHTF